MASSLRKKLGWTVIGFVAAVALAFGCLQVYFSRQLPDPRTNFLTPINSLTTTVPEAEKAWPIYRPVFTEFDFRESNYELFQIFRLSSPGQKARLVAPSDGADWDTAVSELQRLAPLLAALREGGKKPHFGLELQHTILDYPPQDRMALFGDYDFGPPGEGYARDGVPERVAESYGKSLANIRVSHLAILRFAAILLQVDTRLALLERDTDRVVKNIEALFGFADHAQQTKLSIATVYAVALHLEGQECTEDVLSQLSAEFHLGQLKRIRHAVAHAELYDYLDPQFYFLDQYDLVQRWFTDNGKGDGHLTNDWHSYKRLLQELNMSSDNPEPESGFVKIWNWAMRPGLMFFGPSRRETIAILEQQEKMLAAAWRAPWDRDRLTTEIQAIREIETPIELYQDFDGVIVLFDRITNARERQTRIVTSIDLLHSPLMESD